LHGWYCRSSKKKPRQGGVSFLDQVRSVLAGAHNFDLTAAVLRTAFGCEVASDGLLLAFAFCVDAVFLDAF
jgi:hypothetical protein